MRAKSMLKCRKMAVGGLAGFLLIAGACSSSDQEAAFSQADLIQAVTDCMAVSGFEMPEPVMRDGQLGFDPREYPPGDEAFTSQLDVCFGDVAASSGGDEGEVPRLDEAGEAEAYATYTTALLTCMNDRGFEADVDSSSEATEFAWIGVTDPNDPGFVDASFACTEEASQAELEYRLDANGS